MEEGEGSSILSRSFPFLLHSPPNFQCPLSPVSPSCLPYLPLCIFEQKISKSKEISGSQQQVRMFDQVCWIFPLAILWTIRVALIEVRELLTQSLEIRAWSEDLSCVWVPLTLLIWKATCFISEHWLYAAVTWSPPEFQSKHCYERPLQ